MKKVFTLLSLVMMSIMTIHAADYRRTWDFRDGYSASTLEIMAQDATHWEVQPTGFQNTSAFSDLTAVMTYNGEDIVVPELEGLTLGGMKNAKHVQIYDGTVENASFPTSACLWINGKNSYDYIEFTVPAGENVKIGYCSHSATEERGFKVSDGFADADGNTTFKSMATAEIVEVELINSNAEESTLKLSSTSGHHIYYIIIGEGDVPEIANIGYLYYDAAGDGFAELPAYQALQDAESYTFEAVNTATATPTAEQLQAYDAVVIDGSVEATDDIVALLKANIPYQPVLNFNGKIAEALGYGTLLETEQEMVWSTSDASKLFSGYDGYADENLFGISTGAIMPSALKLTAHDGDTKYIVYGTEEYAMPDSVISYVHNSGHNQYIYYGQSGDYAEGTEVILANALAAVVDTKTEVSATSKPAFSAVYQEQQTTVTISDLNKSAEIYYTTDGTDPTLESSVYTEPILFTTEGTLKAIAIAEGYTVSEVNTFDVKLYHQAQQPIISVAGDSDTEDAVITLSSPEEGVDIWYNFVGSDDTLKSSRYTTPITIAHAAEISTFALSDSLALVQSDLKTEQVLANMKKVRRDELAHFKVNGDGWNTLANLYLDGEAFTAWASSNYYFSWGKSAAKSTTTGSEPLTDENGNEILDESGNIQYEETPNAASVMTNSADTAWQITSRGQVMVYQSNTLGETVGDFTGYNPERAEDLIESFGTTADIQFGSIYSGDAATATIETTAKYQAPFNVVAIIANVNGNKTTGVANSAKVAVQVSLDGTTWETVGDTLSTGVVYRNYRKFEVAYEGTDEVYVRLASISGSGQSVHDIYILNHGEQSAAEEDAYTGVTEVAAEEVQPATSKLVKRISEGRILIDTPDGTYTVTGVKVK